jgi:hypothetical protein
MSTKTKPAANGTKKSQGQGPIAKTDSSASSPSVPVKVVVSPLSKPDKAAYDAEQQRIKAEIDLLQEKLVRGVSRLCFSDRTHSKTMLRVL